MFLTRLIPVKKKRIEITPITVRLVKLLPCCIIVMPVYIKPIIPNMVNMVPKVLFTFMVSLIFIKQIRCFDK